MTDVHPEGSENRKPILKKTKTKSTFSFVGLNLVLSMDGHDKLMVYQNSTFPENYGLFGLEHLTITQFILRVGILSTFMNPKHCRII